MGGMFRDPYYSSRRARSVLFGVLMVHIAIIAVPLIYASLTEYLDPPLVVMKVGLVDLPPGDSPDAGQPAPDTAETSDPNPVLDLPADPKQVDPLPDLPPPPPKTETKVTPPKVEQKKTDVAPPPPPKTETKVTPPKTTPPKTEQKKDPPKSNLLTADQIKVTTNTKSQAQIDAENKARAAAEAKAKADAKAREQLLADIRSAAGSKPGTYGTTDPGQKGILATKEIRDYYEQLNAYIRPKWSAVSPANTEISGSISNWPVLELTIEKNGKIRSAIMVAKSGNKKIDAAAELLRADLKAVPVPPQAITIRVTLDIR